MYTSSNMHENIVIAVIRKLLWVSIKILIRPLARPPTLFELFTIIDKKVIEYKSWIYIINYKFFYILHNTYGMEDNLMHILTLGKKS